MHTKLMGMYMILCMYMYICVCVDVCIYMFAYNICVQCIFVSASPIYRAPRPVCNSKSHNVYVCTVLLQVLEALNGFYTGCGTNTLITLVEHPPSKATTRPPQMNTILG